MNRKGPGDQDFAPILGSSGGSLDPWHSLIWSNKSGEEMNQGSRRKIAPVVSIQEVEVK